MIRFHSILPSLDIWLHLADEGPPFFHLGSWRLEIKPPKTNTHKKKKKREDGMLRMSLIRNDSDTTFGAVSAIQGEASRDSGVSIWFAALRCGVSMSSLGSCGFLSLTDF